MSIKYIGRTTNFRGKTLWEIVGNLKNFGVGRIIVRSVFERYPEPSFMKILNVEPLPDEERRKVRVLVERTFRGKKYPKPIEICSTSYKDDYRLLSKDEEIDYCKIQAAYLKEKILPRTIEAPPLLRELIARDMAERGEDASKVPELRINLKEGRDSHSRLAREGETPNTEISIGIGKPITLSLYDGVQL